MNKKKLIIIIVSAVLVTALVITGVILLLKNAFKSNGSKSSDAGEAVITVSDVEAEKGTKIRVPVKISGNPGFMACMLELDYDSSSLKYVTYYKGDFLTDYTFEDNDGVLKFIGVEDADVTKDGTLFELEFEVLKDAKDSEISPVDGDNTALCNFDEEKLSVKTSGGKITVK